MAVNDEKLTTFYDKMRRGIDYLDQAIREIQPFLKTACKRRYELNSSGVINQESEGYNQGIKNVEIEINKREEELYKIVERLRSLTEYKIPKK